MSSTDRKMAIAILDRYRENQVLVQRVAIGVLYVWFGGLKFVPGLSAADELAGHAMSAMTFGLVKPAVSMPLLALLEVLIGIGLISGVWLRMTVVVALGHLVSIFLTLAILPSEIWNSPGVPSLYGQYVLKNVALICALLSVAGSAFAEAPEKPVLDREAGLAN
jgi:uncharacterized membrane protein YkgB